MKWVYPKFHWNKDSIKESCGKVCTPKIESPRVVFAITLMHWVCNVFAFPHSRCGRSSSLHYIVLDLSRNWMKGNLAGHVAFQSMHSNYRGFPVKRVSPRNVMGTPCPNLGFNLRWCIRAEMMIDGNQHQWLMFSNNVWVPDSQVHNESYYWENIKVQQIRTPANLHHLAKPAQLLNILPFFVASSHQTDPNWFS